MEMKAELDKRASDIEQILSRYLPREKGYEKTILEAVNYSVRAGGKRLRPMLMQETYRLFGGNSKVIEPFMAAIEMIHTYSLVHDDLPAMDNDFYRRGKKTTHAVFGEAMGILAGDGLLNLAYETVAGALLQWPDASGMMEAFHVLAKKAGIFGMVGGQTVDVESEGQDIDPEKLDFIYRKKTGALLEASMLVGAILAGADEKQQGTIESVAGKVGMAFQIQDDILDETGTAEVLGKPIGSDKKNRKSTFVAHHGIEASRKKVKGLTLEAMEELDSLPVKNEFLSELLLYLIHRRK